MSSIIYQPKGKAGEYSAWAASLWSGCTNSCAYCYVPLALHKTKEQFHSAVTPRANIKEKFLKDCQELRGSGISVMFSFSCDPYPPEDTELRLTRWGIETLHEYGLYVNILTKGKNATRDFDLLSANDGFACTLTFLNDADSLKWEPKAALPAERIAAIKEAHRIGVTTWASLEPVIDPEQTLEIIRATHEFVDTYKVGKANYIQSTVDWADFGRKAVALMDSLGVNYLVKEDLRKYL